MDHTVLARHLLRDTWDTCASAPMTSAAVHVGRQESAHACFSSFVYIPRSGIVGSCGNSVCSFLRNRSFPFFKRHVSRPSSLGNNLMIPTENIEDLVDHVVLVHESVGEFSKQFLQKLRRSNYVTPKNYLDFINTYSKLLDEKTQYNIGEAREWAVHGTCCSR